MEFRARDFAGEDKVYSLSRISAHSHPLSHSSPSNLQVALAVNEKDVFIDPLRAADASSVESVDNLEHEVNNCSLSKSDDHLLAKEWTSFKKMLMQRVSGSKLVSVSAMSDVITRSGRVHEKESSSTHSEELDDPEKFAQDVAKVIISQQEYLLRLRGLKDEISHAWEADDRVTSLKLSIKVARFLTDTSALQFYPTLFVLATDLLDMLGDMVRQRIRQKAEFSECGNVICTLPEKFEPKDICYDAKETCYNWFSKIGSIRELLPRIYLELAILPCWSFLIDHPLDVLRRLVMMVRGVADPLAAAYCHLYMAHCAQKLPHCDSGFLVLCIDDIKVLLMRLLQELPHEKHQEKSTLLVSLMDPAINYIIKCLIKITYQVPAGCEGLGLSRTLLELLGKPPCISIILHHFLKELPTELVTSNAVEILQLIGCSKNYYSFDQCLNYRLLGFRLSEKRFETQMVIGLVNRVNEVVSEYNSLEDYLSVLEAYIDMILQTQMILLLSIRFKIATFGDVKWQDSHLQFILDGIVKRAHDEAIVEIDLISLQSILVKLVAHFSKLEDIFSLPHVIEILDMMHGTSKNMVNMQILKLVSRNHCIRDPTIIHLLFEVSQSLHDGIDFSNLKDDDNHQLAHLISRFMNMVDHGKDLDRHLAFLVDCRGAFHSIYELKETLVHSCNYLAVKAMKDGHRDLSFVKSCLTFSEVTIPSVPSSAMQLNLYLETAEVALLGGLVSHSDGLLDSAMFCLQSLAMVNGSCSSYDVDGVILLIRKLCSLLVLVPGEPDRVTSILRGVLTASTSLPWMTSGMRTKVFCAILSLAATLCQFQLPYHHEQTLGNDRLYFGDSTCLQELQSLSALILQNLVDQIMQEPSLVVRGSMALEACNCIASSFYLKGEVLPFFSELTETAKSCLSCNDRYLQSTLKYMDKFLKESP